MEIAANIIIYDNLRLFRQTSPCMYFHKQTASLLCARLLRFLLFFLFILCLLIFYVWFNSRPSYTLYNTLTKHEALASRKFILHSPENKYVLFKQLQGAGFNNQVCKLQSICSELLLNYTTGPRNPTISPSRAIYIACLCLSTSHLASSRCQSYCPTVRLLGRCYTEQYQCCCI